jgi:ribosome biogenesis protein YTM1
VFLVFLTDSASHDQSVRFWKWLPDKNIAVPIFVGVGHTRSVEALAVDPNDRMFASGSFDTMLKVWSAGKLTWIFV